jgi:DNA topoisomerase III
MSEEIMVKLVVAEKPSVARDLARVLGAKTRRDGYFEGEGLWVTWCFGHMVQLVEPDAYNPAWKSWRRDQLPMLPEPFKLSPIASSADQWRILKRLMGDREVEGVVNACDAGREGELIFRYVYELAGCKKPMQRLWLASLTDQAVKKAWGQLKAGRDYDALADAARCRAEADWLVGMNATRALTIQARVGAPAGKGALLSVGRVQTPTLAMVVQREQTIESFVPRTFWQIYCIFGVPEGEPPTYEGMWFDPDKERARKKLGRRDPGAEWEDAGDADPARIWDEAEANAVLAEVRDQPGAVRKMEQKDVREKPPLLFDLTGLQRAANQRYGFSAQHTLDTAQALYERHKLLTYPRTDSNYLTSDMKSGLEKIVQAVNSGPWAPFCDYLLSNLPLNTSSRIINDAEVGDHHAIIPTDRTPSGDGLTVDEKRLYDMVVRRFLGAFYPDAVFATTRIETEVCGHLFVTRGRMRKEAGWQEVEPTAADRGASAKDAAKKGGKGAKDKDAGPALPLLHEGDAVSVERARRHEGQTQPPRRYNESSLLGAMERAGQELDDEAMRRAMKEAGLGTPATRASMIETLLRRQYIERDGKALVPTQSGRALIDALPTDDLKSAALTGQWEARLSSVAAGKVTRADFMEETRAMCARLVRELLSRRVEMPASAQGAQGEVLGRCPVCKTEVTETFHTYSCGGGRDCTFVIYKKVAGKDIKPNLVKLLLSGKTSQAFKGFKSKSGKAFEAALRLSAEGKVELVFDQDAPRRSPPAREEQPVEEAPAKRSRAKKASEAADAAAVEDAPKPKRTRAKKVVEAAPEAEEAAAKPKRTRAKKAVEVEAEPAPVEAPRVARKPARAPVAEEGEAASPEGMACPMCKEGALMRGKRGWGCTRWREGCRFVLWQTGEGGERSDREIAEIVRGLAGG